MKQFWKAPVGINGLLYGVPATIFTPAKERAVKPEPTREGRIAAENLRAHNAAVQFERDRRLVQRRARQRNDAKK